MNGRGGIVEKNYFEGISEFVTAPKERYFWIVTRIFRRESERPAKCKTMKMKEGERGAEREECVPRRIYIVLSVVSTSLSRVARATIISVCTAMNLRPRLLLRSS